jgi:hypothetical protein
MANGTIAASQLEMLSLSGTGIITITPPATNTNRAITLPDAAGALVVSGTTPSLNGITFPATQVPSADANTLDDYEEGTWTPTAGGSSGESGQTYGERTGRYTKIGRTVFVTFDVQLTTAGSISGDAVVSGLPFAVPNVGDLSNAMGSLSLAFTTGASYTWQGTAPQNNTSYFNIFVKTAAATSTSNPLGSTFFVNGTRIVGGGFYNV